MRAAQSLPPRILIIDDVYGRSVDVSGNTDRTALCLQLRLEDMTSERAAEVTIPHPIARVVFCRGQLPVRACVGDVVENDLPLRTRHHGE
jgi:hypothetical protein